ncbi:MAG: RagB/SusD family nutrient uptake outer membrane protein [Fermentimonas sp.]|nr:RagB/SusD family nutrient uptake outer membrane protein [Fermentimonas sp.]
MKKINILIVFIITLLMVGCEDFLTRDPLDKITDTPQFWNNEENIRTYTVGLYDQYFEGWRSSWSRTDWFSETNIADWNDNNAQNAATFFTKVTPATDATNWRFVNLRRVNILIDRASNSDMPDEAKNHWVGVGRFLRALEYHKLVSKYGDVPWFDAPLESNDMDQLYKQRDSRVTVMDNVAADLEFANSNIRESDGTKGLTINRSVALAFTSKVMLFEGTWQKYRENNTAKATEYLNIAKNAAAQVMAGNKYSLTPNFKDLTTSISLAGNPEVILYREYEEGVLMHSLMSFQNTEFQGNSPSRSLIDNYLSTNGLPIKQDENDVFKGDKWFFDEIADRDPRLHAIIDTDGLRLEGVATVYAASGYFTNKFVNESLIDKPGGMSSTNITDAPIMKLNEVLMNYIEAAVELADMGAYTLTQNDFDISINKLRSRPSTNMPHVTLTGNALSVGGVVVNDPARDADVSSLIWEVRRERRSELAYEGNRFNDIRRWNKLNYADMVLNPQLNLGAWVDKPRYVQWYNEEFSPAVPLTIADLDNIRLDRPGDAGYIKPIATEALMRTYSEKDYLYPIPTDQITLYQTKGVTLTQNPGWN